MPVSIGWKSECPARNVLTIFFCGTGRSLEPSLWCESSDFVGEVWVLSQKLIPDTSWSAKFTGPIPEFVKK